MSESGRRKRRERSERSGSIMRSGASEASGAKLLYPSEARGSVGSRRTVVVDGNGEVVFWFNGLLADGTEWES